MVVIASTPGAHRSPVGRVGRQVSRVKCRVSQVPWGLVARDRSISPVCRSNVNAVFIPFDRR